MNYDWAELAFSDKKPVNRLGAIFITAPRELSSKRFTQLIKTYLPQGNIVLGLSKEEYVVGFEAQPQFKMLHTDGVHALIDKVNGSSSKYKIYTLSYNQRDLKFLLEKLDFKKVLFINGSWSNTIHTRPEYYVLAKRHIEYALLSPFASEQEARDYAAAYESTDKGVLGELGIIKKSKTVASDKLYSESEMLQYALQAAKHSFDYSFQTGASLGLKQEGKYRLLATAFNEVVPFQTYAMHYGASREQNFSPMNDLNHYDAVHAEVALILQAQKDNISLHNTTMFINLLPCPSCARMLSQTEIAEFVYSQDHSSGYGLKMLELAGKKVTRKV
jgi:deoxycytidylate deaminase